MKEGVAGEQVHLSGAVNGRYVSADQRSDGRLVIVPDTSWQATSERAGGREPRPEEWEQLIDENGPHMLPPDGEG